MFQPFLHLYADPSTARPGSNLKDSALEGTTIPLLNSFCCFFLIEVGCHFLFQGIFPTQGSSPRLLPWQTDSLPLSHPGSHCTVFLDFHYCLDASEDLKLLENEGHSLYI